MRILSLTIEIMLESNPEKIQNLSTESARLTSSGAQAEAEHTRSSIPRAARKPRPSLDRHTRSLAKVARDVEILQEAFAVFTKLWFAHTPRISESERESAQTFAEGRYHQFCEYVGRQLGAGHAFVDDVASDLPLDSPSVQDDSYE